MSVAAIDELIDPDELSKRSPYYWVPPCEKSAASPDFKIVVGGRGSDPTEGFIRVRHQGSMSDIVTLSTLELMALAVACIRAVKEIENRNQTDAV